MKPARVITLIATLAAFTNYAPVTATTRIADPSYSDLDCMIDKESLDLWGYAIADCTYTTTNDSCREATISYDEAIRSYQANCSDKEIRK